MNVTKQTFTLPADLAEKLPIQVEYETLTPYLSVSGRGGKVLFEHSNRVAFHYFDNQEACSGGGQYSNKLRQNMVDRARSGYVVLPTNTKLRAAEVYDGGADYENIDVQCVSDNERDTVHVTYKPVVGPRYRTPLTEKQRTENLENHLEKYLSEEQLPLSLKPYKRMNISGYCRFSGGGHITMMSNQGVIVIGGTCVDQDEEVTPLKDGDVPATSTIENKLATNPKTYEETEKQLFANMHRSASEATICGLIQGDLNATRVKRMIGYGTILKPGNNIVSLYKLVAELNGNTYIQIDFEVETIFWHNYFDRVLLYMFNKLCKTRGGAH